MSSKNIVLHIVISLLSWSCALASAQDARPEEDRMALTIGFLHPLATNANRPNVTSSVDLSVLYGRVGTVEGLQLGGVVDYAARGITGVQLAGVGAITGGSASGAQLAGVFNLSTGPTTGAQLAGVVNVAADSVTGAQLAPVNIAGPVQGVQIGVVNIGRKVRGLQLGVINIADEVDGAAIGLVSISRDSVHPIVWASNLQYMNVGVKFSTKYVFTLLGVHYGTHEADFDKVGLTFGLGGHLPLPARFDLEVQGSFTQLAPWKHGDKYKTNSWIAPQIAVGYSFAPHLRVFVGTGVRVPLSVDLGRAVSRPEFLAGLQF